jgi:Tfp pilus assembly protein PilF
LTQDQRQELERRRSEWLAKPSETFASEFVGTALLLGVPEEAQDAVEFLSNERGTRSTSLLAHRAGLREERRTLALFKPRPDYTTARQSVVSFKQATIRDPRNAIAWSELARWYTTLGRPRQAEHAMHIAMALAPDSRYILRSAACCFVSIGQPQAAHQFLVQSSATQQDPWLLATELATANAAGRPPQFMKTARSMLDRGTFSPFQLSELASEVGTLDLGGGNDRRARKLLRQALVEPTENSLAQVEWASHVTPGIIIPDSSLDLPLADEARALHAAEEGDWLDALASATKWLGDQVFSSQAAMVASHAASVGLMDWDEGFEKAVFGLQSHPQSAGLLNNAAYPLIEMGKYDEAAEFLGRVRTEWAQVDDQICLQATKGLLAFRTGYPELGRRLYERSIEVARSSHGKEYFEAMATVLLAREELSVNRDSGLAVLTDAEKLAEKVKNRALERWLKLVQEMARI